MSPLYIAAQRGHNKCIKLLIDRDADPYIITKNESLNTNCNALNVAWYCDKYSSYRLIKKLIKNRNLANSLNNYESILSSTSNTLKHSLISS